MLMTKSITTDIDKATHAFMEAIAAFPPETFNRIPFEGSWTAAQVADHIRKAMVGVPGLLAGPTSLSERAADEKVGQIRDLFMNFNTRFQSPDFILPTNAQLDKEGVLSDLEDITAQLMNASEALDLSALCTASELPGFGILSREEWIRFSIYHTRRHTHQLNNIYAAIVH